MSTGLIVALLRMACPMAGRAWNHDKKVLAQRRQAGQGWWNPSTAVIVALAGLTLLLLLGSLK